MKKPRFYSTGLDASIQYCILPTLALWLDVLIEYCKLLTSLNFLFKVLIEYCKLLTSLALLLDVLI